MQEKLEKSFSAQLGNYELKQFRKGTYKIHFYFLLRSSIFSQVHIFKKDYSFCFFHFGFTFWNGRSFLHCLYCTSRHKCFSARAVGIWEGGGDMSLPPPFLSDLLILSQLCKYIGHAHHIIMSYEANLKFQLTKYRYLILIDSKNCIK